MKRYGNLYQEKSYNNLTTIRTYCPGNNNPCYGGYCSECKNYGYLKRHCAMQSKR